MMHQYMLMTACFALAEYFYIWTSIVSRLVQCLGLCSLTINFSHKSSFIAAKTIKHGQKYLFFGKERQGTLQRQIETKNILASVRRVTL